MFKRYQDTSNLSNGWVTGRYLLLICTDAINNRLSIARSYMQLYCIYSYLRLWQEGTRFNGSDFYQLLLTYMYLGDCEDTGTKTQVRTAANSALKHIFLS